MKLLIYRVSLLIALFGVLSGTIYSLVYTFQIAEKYEPKSDLVLFSICFVLLIIFVGLEIFNTIRSFKKGSNFIYPLVINKDESKNKPFLIIINCLLPLLIGILIYSSLIAAGFQISLSTLPFPLILMCINFFSLLIIDLIFIDFYLLLYKEENRKK